MDNTDVKLLELMASKICHDLISPVGAVANGVEILEELGGDMDGDVTSLIAHSTKQANAKLKTLRLAYGLGGADSNIRPEDVHTAYGEYVAGENRLHQDWDPHGDIGIQLAAGFGKALTCCLILAGEALPKGGNISVKADGENTALITGEGENAHLKHDTLAALLNETAVDALEPQNVHPYITGLFLKKYGFTIDHDDTQDDFIFLRLKSPDVL